MIDLHWLVGILIAVASAAISACVPFATAILTRHLKIAGSSAISADIDNIVTNAARVAIDELSSIGAHNVKMVTKSAAVAKGVNTVLGLAQTAIQAKGITQDDLTAMVSGEVTKLLNHFQATSPQISPSSAPSIATT